MDAIIACPNDLHRTLGAPVTEVHRAGFVAIVGRPNVGKSTLVNGLVGHKIAIVTRRPQTTRRRALGIVTRPNCQLILVDSPGIHAGSGRLLDRALHRSAVEAVGESDVVISVIDPMHWHAEDDYALKLATASGHPVVLALNKVDRIGSDEQLLEILKDLDQAQLGVRAIVPISARSGYNLRHLADVVAGLVPASPCLYPEEQITDLSPAERLAEAVREALINRLGDELPYSTYVSVEHYDESPAGRIQADVTIWVDRPSQKGIVIGAGGRMVKAIGMASRSAFGRTMGREVDLRVRVNLNSGWSRDSRVLGELGLGQ